MRVVIAGMALRLEGLAAEDELLIRSRYGLFIRDTGDVGKEARVRVVEADVPGFLRFGGQAAGEPETYRLVQRWQDARLFAHSYEFAGWYDPRTQEGQLALASAAGESLFRAVENYLRVVTAHRALERGGFLLHASGLVREGRARVFFGPSGSGKTTVTLLSPGDLALGDDLVLIQRGEKGYEAVAVPFRGLYREPPETDRAFPLAGFYRLLQCPADSLETLSPARGVAELMGSLPFVVQGGNPEKAMDAVSDAVAEVPVHRLRFRKSPEFWDLLSEER